MLISNVRLFSGKTDSLIEDSSIWIEDNIIRYAGPSNKLKDVPDNQVVVFSAHGTAPDVFKEAENRGLKIIDVEK